MKLKGKNKKFMVFGAGLVLIILLAAVVFTVATSVSANNFDPVEDSGSPKTQITPVQNNQQNQPNPTPTPYIQPQPTQTPYQWIDPSPPPTPTLATTPTLSAFVWQTLYVTNLDGSTYWVNPPKPTNPLAIWASPNKDASNFKQISYLQNNIYMKIDSAKTVQSWMFSAKETIAVTDLNGNIKGTIANDATVSKNGGSVANGQNTYVLGASLTAQQLQPLIRNIVSYGTPHYFVIKLSNIQLQLTFTDGSGQTLSASGGDASNTLAWLIAITPY